MTTGLRVKTLKDSDWHLEFCDFIAAWDLTPPRPEGELKGEQEGKGVTVVQLDTGYTDHPEIKCDRYLIQQGIARNFLKEPGTYTMLRPDLRDASDDLTGWSANHGTATASVLMSGKGKPADDSYTASKWIWGVAPKVKVIPFRVTKWVALTDEATTALARAIFYVVDKMNTQRIGVISISLGRSGFEGTTGEVIDTLKGGVQGKLRLIEALEAAVEKGIVVCAAAGQLQQKWMGTNVGPPAFPGRNRNAICVAGCIPGTLDDPEDHRNYEAIPSGFLGLEVDITAPAFDIYAAKSVKGDPNPSYDIEESAWGTSYATAIVAGACALWQAHHGRKWLLANYGPELLFPLFKEVLKRSAFIPTPWNTGLRGAGVLDAKKLLLEDLPKKNVIQALVNTD